MSRTKSGTKVLEVMEGLCFTEDTPIYTEEGYKPIKEIKIGDIVYSENSTTGEKGLKKVTNVFINETGKIMHVYVGSEEIKATQSHPFWVIGKGWVEAEALEIGDRLLTYSGKELEVKFLIAEVLEVPIKVYNFEVENWHTYFVSDSNILVHNSCKMPILTPQTLNKFYSRVLSGEDLHFASKEQALEFIQKKFPNFQQEVAKGRSKEGWHFDSHPINDSSEAIEHINIYSKKQDFRVHITWED